MEKRKNFWNKAKYGYLYLLSLIPTFILYLLSDFCFLIIYRLANYRRDIVRKNLNNSFPNKTEQEIIVIEKGFYHHFCDLIFEMVKILGVRKSWGIKRLKLVNPEILHKYYEEGRSIIFYMAHHGNWEMFSFLALMSPHKLLAFYQPLSNKYFNDVVLNMRERQGVTGVMSSRGYKELMRYRQEGILTSTMILGDQSPGGSSTRYWTTFLNQETAFLVGADRIAKKSNQVLLYPSWSKSKRGFYEVEFKLITDKAKDMSGEEIVDKYAALMEESIKSSPELYLWSHNRWKLKKE